MLKFLWNYRPFIRTRDGFALAEATVSAKGENLSRICRAREEDVRFNLMRS